MEAVRWIARRVVLLVSLLVAGSVAALPTSAALGGAKTESTTAGKPPAQRIFASPDDAAAALVDALRGGDKNAIAAVFGPGSEGVISSGDPYADQSQFQRFVDAYDAKHQLVPGGNGHFMLEVGTDNWPLPIPIVKADGGWRFDAAAGAQEIINRRIGRNEIAAIRTCLAYADAQQDYFELFKEATGEGAYAQRLVSTPGNYDGLYWPPAEGIPDSPLEALVSQAIEEGYPGENVSGKPIPYHGYFFRILKAQGANAPGGAKDYVQKGKMTGGYALLAWPAAYGNSGIMTFQVNQDGIVFQKDLGPETAQRAGAITRFDPDLSWARVEVATQ
ncbi:MAG: DUF2950 domain-containing protein [Acetobacteraceae bacterium]|nr:DUF2950 domain-containing protein [Acetobacteraceae bacterium]